MEEYHKDDLTGLLSRRYLSLLAQRELEQSKRYKEHFSIMILDIDDFKLINDMYGHQKGDSVLVLFSEILKRTFRESDSIIRYGGDEFVVIMPRIGKKEASVAAERVVNTLKDRKIGGIQLSVSIGIGVYPDNGDTWEEVFSAADKSLYVAKRRGKGRYEMAGGVSVGIKIPTKSLIGRRSEKGEVARMVEDIGKLHLVIGEIGIGKTRLVLDTIRIMGKESIYARCIGAVGNMPYHLLRNIVKKIVKKYGSKVFSVYESMHDALKREMKKLMLDVLTKNVSTGEGGDKYRLYEALLNLLVNLGDGNILLVLDDLQWIDKESMEFISYILQMAREHFTLIGIVRREDIAKCPIHETLRYLGRLDLYDTLELGPLSKVETKMLLYSALDAEVEDKVVDMVYKDSGGNPLFIEELLKYLYDNNSIVLRNDTYVLKQKVKIKIPGKIKDIVEEKIKSFNDEEMQILGLAAIMGKTALPFLISKVSGINEGEVYDALDKATKLKLMSETEDGVYIFPEGIVKDVILDKMSKGKRRYFHEKAAEVLLKEYEDNIEEVVECIINHFDEGGLKEKGDHYCKIAGDKFYYLYAYEKAIDYYVRVLDRIENVEEAREIINRVYNAYWNIGNYEGFMPIAEKLLKRFPDLAGDIYGQMANLYNEAGKVEYTIQLIEKGISSIESQDSVQRLKISLAWALAYEGEMEKAEDTIKDVIEFFKKKIELPDLIDAQRDIIYGNLGSAYNTLALIYKINNNREKAIEYFKKGLEYAEKGKNIDYQDVSVLYLNIAMCYLEMNDVENSFKHLKMAKSNIKNAPSFAIESGIDQMLGEAYIMAGELDVGENLLKDALKRYKAMNNYYRIVETSLNLTELYILEGNFTLTLKILLQIKEIVDDVGYKRFALWSIYNRFLAHLYSGFLNECKKDIEDLKREMKDDKRYIHYLLEAEGMLANEEGDYEKAVYFYKELLQTESENMLYSIGLAKAYAKLRRIKKAKEILKKVELLNKKVKAAFLRMKNEFYIGEIYHLLGENDKAISIFKRIYPEFQKSGAHLYTRKIDAFHYF